MRRYLFTVPIFALLFILTTESVFAGFGITPPYVRNQSLTRNSEYEQRIIVVRSDPTSDLKAQVTIDVPGINDWFSIDEGEEFLLPQGEEKVPMTVRVRVPDRAQFKQYTGNIRIRTATPDGQVTAGSVSIALGAQIDVDISVIDKEIKDFRVRKITLSDLNEGHSRWWLYFPGKINFDLLLENTGNIDVAPSEVTFDIYDATGQILLEQTKNKNKIDKVKPFETETVTAELPTRLPAGSYIARYKVFNDEEIKQEGELNLSILPFGTLNTAGYGFSGLSLWHKTTIVGPTLIIILLGAILVTHFRYQRTTGGSSRSRTTTRKTAVRKSRSASTTKAKTRRKTVTKKKS